MATVNNPNDNYEIKDKKDIRKGNAADLIAWTSKNVNPVGVYDQRSQLPTRYLDSADDARTTQEKIRFYQENPGDPKSKEFLTNTPSGVSGITADGVGNLKIPQNAYLTDPLSEDNPLPWQRYLPTQTVGIADDIYSRLGDLNDPTKGDPGDDKALGRGIENSIAMKPTGNPTLDAIQNKYSSRANDALSAKKAEREVGWYERQSKNMSRAAAIYGKQQAIRLQNFKEQYQFQMQRAEAFNAQQRAEFAAKAQFLSSIFGLSGTGVGALAASDFRLKKNIELTDTKEFLDSFSAYRYQYKDARFGGGTYVSPMAQELEKTDLGKDLVVNTPQGKMVDYGKAFGLMLASLSDINKRLNKLEKKNG